MSVFKKHIGLILVLLLSFVTIQPLLASGFFPMHDDTQVVRVFEMKTALTDGMFPVRWVPDLGYNYGYPIFNFYGPLAYYVGGFFNLIGFDSLIATKLMIGLGMLLAGIFMYLFAREFWGKYGGVVSAILYMYAPYHALNVYVRGAIGELWAYGFLPLAFFSSYKLFRSLVPQASLSAKKQKNNIVRPIYHVWIWAAIAASSYAAIVVSHNLTAMMVTPFLFVFITFLYISARRKNHTIMPPYFILLSFLLGIFLSAFYWLPVLLEMKFTNVLSVVGGGSDYRDHFVCLTQLWNSPWGYGGSVPGCLDGLSFRLGKFHIIIALFSLIPLVYFRKQKTVTISILMSLVGAVVSIFLMLENAKFIWDALPQMAFFQFPWRFLILASFFLSFLGGALFIIFKNNKTISLLLGVLIVFVVMLQNAKLFIPDKIVNKTAADYTSKSEIRWRVSKISDEYMPPGFQKPMASREVPQKKVAATKDITILSSYEKTKVIHAEVDAKEKKDMLVNLAYFPGWHVYVDHKQDWFKHFGKGILVTVPKGKHTIDIVFLQTPIEQLGNALSIAGVFILLAGIISSRKERKGV
jgi:hypothetical protein